MSVRYRVQLEGKTVFVSDEEILKGLSDKQEYNTALMGCYTALHEMQVEEKNTSGHDISALSGFWDGIRVQIEMLDLGFVRNSS
jgi:hypothetical protein